MGGIADIAGSYPSDGGIGERGAWFRDSESWVQRSVGTLLIDFAARLATSDR